MEIAQKPLPGRPKGSGNRAKFNIEAFIAKVEKASGRTLAELVASVLSDPRTKAAMVVKLLAYRYGEPQAHIEMDGKASVEHTIRFVQAKLEAGRKRAADAAQAMLTPKAAELPEPLEIPEKAQSLEVAEEMPISTRPSSHKGLF